LIITRQNLIKGNWSLLAIGVMLTAGAFAAPTDLQLIFLALGLGSVTFSGFWAIILLITAQKRPRH
jgi:hypothetical protein